LLTITSLTERAMIHFARDHNLGFDDEPRRLVEVS
jgi:cholesterol oxidase